MVSNECYIRHHAGEFVSTALPHSWKVYRRPRAGFAQLRDRRTPARMEKMSRSSAQRSHTLPLPPSVVTAVREAAPRVEHLLMKCIATQPGDTVEISIRGFSVNGNALPNSAPMNIGTEGLRLQHWPFGKYRVQTGTVWVISSYSCRSFDSRYFGPRRGKQNPPSSASAADRMNAHRKFLICAAGGEPESGVSPVAQTANIQDVSLDAANSQDYRARAVKTPG